MKESLLIIPGNRPHRFFATILPGKEKTRLDVTDEGRQDKYDSAIACKCQRFVFVPIPMFFQLFEISLAIRETDWHRFSVKRSFQLASLQSLQYKNEIQNTAVIKKME